MKGRWLRVLELLLFLAVPLVFYEGLTMAVFFVYQVLCPQVRQEHALLLTGIAGSAAAVVLGISYLLLIRPEYARRRKGRSRRSLAAHLLMLPAAAASCVAGNILVAFLNIQSEAFDQVNTLLFMPSLKLQLVCMVLVIPLTEELIFRGFAFGKLRTVWGFWPSAFCSALYFGIFHGNLPQGIYAFLIGLELAFCCEWFGGVYASYLFHAVVNLVAVLLMNAFA